MRKISRKIKKIRESDQAVKNRWTWFLTVCASLVIVFSWTVYLNWSLESVSYEGVAGAQNKQVSVFKTFLAGVLALKDQAQDGVDVLMKENLVIIDMPKQNFVYNDLEKMKLINLP